MARIPLVPSELGLGTTPNDGTGSQLRAGGQVIRDWMDDINAMTAEMYTGKVSGTGRIILLGDSIVSQHNDAWTPSAITRSGSVGTATVTGANLVDGTPVYGMRASDDGYNGFKNLTRVDTNTYQFPVTGTPATPATPGGAGSFAMANLLKRSDRGWFNWANMLLGWPFEIVHNAAVGGDRATALDAHITNDVVPYDADWVLISSGINDIAADTSAATVANTLIAACNRLLANGRKVLLCTIVPLHNGSASYSVARAHALLVVNRTLIAYARATQGVWLADLFGPMVDPSQSVMTIKSGYGDGIHPYAIGGYAIGAKFAADFANLYPQQLSLPQSASEDYAVNSAEPQINTNPLMLGTAGTLSGGPTGTVADGWTLLQGGTITIVGSVAARADGYGNNQVITCSGSSGTGHAYLYNTTSLDARVSTGTKLIGVCELDLSGLTGLAKIEHSIQISVGGAGQSGPYGLSGDATTFPQGNVNLKIRSPEFTIPAGSITALRSQIHIQFNTGGGGVLKVGRFGLYKQP